MAKAKAAAGVVTLETRPSAGQRVTYRFTDEVDRALGLSPARKRGPATFERAIRQAEDKGFVLRGELAAEGHHLVVVERRPPS
jgi:hypothetical protein